MMRIVTSAGIRRRARPERGETRRQYGKGAVCGWLSRRRVKTFRHNEEKKVERYARGQAISERRGGAVEDDAEDKKEDKAQ